MTLREIIERVDRLKPNQYEETDKVAWVNELEGKLIEEVFGKAVDSAEYVPLEFTGYDWGTDADTVLLVPNQFCDIYVKYLFAQIDFHNAEFTRYNNSTMMFNAVYDEFAAYWRRNHMPRQSASLRPI